MVFGPRAVGTVLLSIGSVYFTVMVIRYGIRMSLYPLERWAGGSIPVFFHWVLAAFILVLGAYHRGSFPVPVRRSRAVRLIEAAAWLLIVAGILVWAGYQLSPTILVRIPFSSTFYNSLLATVVGRFWAERGYTVVIQGTRGRFQSGGRHTPLVDERRDGLETLDWLKRQPWFDGRLGMWGGSAFGYTQWAIADQLPSPPNGRSALMVQVSSTDFHGMFYPGHAFSLVALKASGDASPSTAV